MKKLFATGLIAGLMAISSIAMAATPNEIINAAKAEVPAAAGMYVYKDDGPNKLELRFRDTENFLDYEVKVDKATCAVLEVEITGSNSAKSTTVRKSLQDIEQIVLAAYPDASNLVVELDKDGNQYEYEAKFETAKYRKVELELNPATGAITKHELKLR